MADLRAQHSATFPNAVIYHKEIVVGREHVLVYEMSPPLRWIGALPLAILHEA